jgi:hypothetical protein
MSTYIKAFTPDTDPEYQKHKKLWDICEEMGVSLPKETEEYFKNCDTPEDKLEIDLEKDVHFEEYEDDSSQGVEVDITKLPKGVTKLRFYNSW